MPRNRIGGKGHKRGKNRPINDKVKEISIAKKEEGEVYGQVVRRLGEKHILFTCSDGKERTCVIPGKFYKKVWINKGDIVLIDTKAKGDDETNGLIVEKYDHDGVRFLKSKREINFDAEEQEDDLIEDGLESNPNTNQRKISDQPNRFDRDMGTSDDSEEDEESEEDDEEEESDEEEGDNEEDNDEKPKKKEYVSHHGFGKEARNPREKKKFDERRNQNKGKGPRK